MSETQKKSIDKKKEKQAEDCNFSAQQVLDFIGQADKINLDDVLEEMLEKEKEKAIAKCHKYRIWQATDGRWRTYIKDDTQPHGRKLVIKTSKKVLEDFLIDHYQIKSEEEEKRSMTLRTLYPQWLEYKSLSSAPSYVMRIESDWRSCYLDSEIIDIPIQKLDKLTLETWALKLIKCHDIVDGESRVMTHDRYYDVSVIMRQELHYAVDLGVISQSPFDLVRIDGRRLFRKVRKKPAYTQVFTVEEEKEITRMAWDDFHNHVKVYDLAPLALLMQFKTGMRIGEVVALKFSDVETPNEIHVQRMARRDTKEVVDHTKGASDDRYVILTSEAKELIETCRERQKELHAENDYIFSIDGEPITERSVSDLYTKYCKKMGIIKKSSHKSRKTYITTLLDSGVSINTVREQAGHSDERTTLKNYAYDRSTDIEKQRKFEEALRIK